MTDEKLKVQIGTNISNLRKRQRLTQAGLAEKLNYSDKAVSKWERGESTRYFDFGIHCGSAGRDGG